MKRYILYIILSTLSLGVMAQANPAGGVRMDCGTWFTLSAHAYEDYHFVEWNDGSKDSVRYLEVTADATYIAFFAANCPDWNNWPVQTIHDWLLRLNVEEINAAGYYFGPNDVTWYRVVGEPDSPDGEGDDIMVGKGYYLSIDRNFLGIGDYYAVVDVSVNAKAQLCGDVMRSVLVQYAGTGTDHTLALMPNATTPGGDIKLDGLDPTEISYIMIYSSAGHLMDELHVTGEPAYVLQAAGVSGCYYVKVLSPTMDVVLKYIVYAR